MNTWSWHENSHIWILLAYYTMHKCYCYTLLSYIMIRFHELVIFPDPPPFRKITNDFKQYMSLADVKLYLHLAR